MDIKEKIRQELSGVIRDIEIKEGCNGLVFFVSNKEHNFTALFEIKHLEQCLESMKRMLYNKNIIKNNKDKKLLKEIIYV